MRAPRIRIKDLPPEQQKEVRRLKRVITAAERVEFRAWCHAGGLPEPAPEHRFHPIREWRLDWAFLGFRVALEIEGGVWTEGRHTRGAGFVEDMRKYNEAAVLGWTVLRVTPEQLYTGDTLDLLLRAISLRSEHPMTDTQQSPAGRAGFTPGPWSADGGSGYVMAEDGQMPVCEVRGWGYLSTRRESEDAAAAEQDANARLISAAPDLLAALRPFAAFACEETGDDCECNNCRARAAIRKAVGG